MIWERTRFLGMSFLRCLPAATMKRRAGSWWLQKEQLKKQRRNEEKIKRGILT